MKFFALNWVLGSLARPRPSMQIPSRLLKY